MKFLDRKICERLVELGCKSENGFYYNHNENGERPYTTMIDPFTALHESYYIPDPRSSCHTQAFTIYDLIAQTQLARDNARKVWPQSSYVRADCPDDKPGCLVYHTREVFKADEMRHRLIDVKTEDEAEKLIADAVGVEI